MEKQCPSCLARTTKKIGQHRGRQRFQCTSCGKKFQNARRERTRFLDQLWHDYVWKKQTLEQLSITYHKSIPWIQAALERHELQLPALTPQPTVVVGDGFYFQRGLGIMLFRSPSLHRNLHWFQIGYETIDDYRRGVARLERDGWTVQAFVCDGRPGVKVAFAGRFPVQMCHFHQVAIVTRYLTQRPKLPAAQELKAIVATLKVATEADFTAALTRWSEQWAYFLKERTLFDARTKTGRQRWWYSHRRIRSAYRSLVANLPYLFTFERYPDLHIPKTTNSLDGSISHLRDKLGTHRGVKLTQRIKITEELLKGKDPLKFQ